MTKASYSKLLGRSGSGGRRAGTSGKKTLVKGTSEEKKFSWQNFIFGKGTSGKKTFLGEGPSGPRKGVVWVRGGARYYPHL